MEASTPEAGSHPIAQGVHALCKRAWWAFLIGGIASVVFGALVLFNPAMGLFIMAVFFAASILVDGAANVWGALTNREKDGWWVLLLIGIAGVAVGAFALLHPAITMVAFVYAVGLFALLLGALLVSLGWKIRKETKREWVLYLTGALSLLFGLLIFLQPAAGALSVVYMIAYWAILIGALRIFFAFKVKNLKDEVAEFAAT